MKSLILPIVLLSFVNTAMGQLRGDGNIATERFPIPTIQEVIINVNGNLIIDASANENYIEISADQNLIQSLIPDLEGNTMELTQKEWVEATQEIQYKIVSDKITVIKNDSWTDVQVTGLDQNKLRYQSLVGAKASFEGKLDEFRLGMESGKVEASKLEVKTAYVNIWDRAEATLNVSGELHANVSNGGKLVYVADSTNVTKTTSKGGQVLSITQANNAKDTPRKKTRYIEFKIKSKDTQVIQAYVEGPKPNGGTFSYGLPIRPFIPKKENWTIGTKLYAVNSLGMKKLIYTVKEEDEGKVVTVSKR